MDTEHDRVVQLGEEIGVLIGLAYKLSGTSSIKTIGPVAQLDEQIGVDWSWSTARATTTTDVP
jgi:hypothetical protein